MKYYFSLLRRETRNARMGILVSALLVLVVSQVLARYVKEWDADIVRYVGALLAQLHLVAGFLRELFCAIPTITEDAFGHLLPQPERKSLLAIVCSLLFSAFLYMISSIVLELLYEFLQTHSLQAVRQGLTAFSPQLLLLHLPVALLELLFIITLVMALQLLLHRLGQRFHLAGKVPTVVGRVFAFFCTIGLCCFWIWVANNVMLRFPWYLDVLQGTLVNTRPATYIMQNFWMSGLQVSEEGRSVWSVAVLAGMFLLTILQWVFSLILVEDHLDWEV